MTDTVQTNTIFSGARKKVYQFTNISDGVGESAVVKIDRSTLTGPSGTVPTNIVVEQLQWSIQGFTSVRLFWEHSSGDDEIVLLAPGNGVASWVAVGGLKQPTAVSAATDGDIYITTNGAVSGATYTITIVVRLKD